jgi:transposase, IS30 family
MMGVGGSLQRAAEAGRCSERTVQRVMAAAGGVRVRNHPRAQIRLSLVEREEISLGMQAQQTFVAIARGLGRSPSTVSREVAANGGRGRYRAAHADERAYQQGRRPKRAKLAANGRLRERVEQMLGEKWSPQQISVMLRLEFPDELEMRVSHETIYQSLFVQGRGALRKELTAALRSGRTRRRAQGRKPPELIKAMVMISERPAEIEDRAVPGHWEGDLIIGKNGKSAIMTLVERHTRYVMLGQIGTDRTSPTVCHALKQRIQTLPEHLAKSVTWDQGREMAGHARFTIDTGIQVYFCDPHSPWQRGSNENTNGLLRQYFPKGTDLAVHTQAHLDEVALQLNGRPRQTLGWANPHDKLNALIATTA